MTAGLFIAGLERRFLFLASSILPISIKELWKYFSLDKPVLKGIDLTIIDGETVGILGNNGSGKTTLLRILATLLYPSSGQIEIFGLDPRFQASEIKPLIGYLPERFSFYPYFSVNDILDFFLRLSSRNTTNQVELKEHVIRLLKIDSYLPAQIHTLSKGMLQKVGLAITLLHDPPLLLLDEPTSGLDPLVRAQVRKILMNFTNDFDKTVVISSHILEDVNSICDRVFFLEAGKMLHEPYWISDLQQKVSKLLRLEIKTINSLLIFNEFQSWEEVLYSDLSVDSVDLYCKKAHVYLVRKHLEEIFTFPISLVTHPITLEDIYIFNHAKINWFDFLS